MNTINLDLITGAKNIINLMQFDVKGEKVNIVLTENDVAYNLSGKTVRLQGIKADKKALLLPTVIKDKNIIEFEITEQLTVVSGIVQLQLLIFGENGSLKNSKIFVICIDESLNIGEIIASDNDFKEIKDTLIKVEEWDKYFLETNGKLEEKYTTRLNGIDNNLADNKKKLGYSELQTKLISKFFKKLQLREGVTKIVGIGDSKMYGTDLTSTDTRPPFPTTFPDGTTNTINRASTTITEALQNALQEVYGAGQVIVDNMGRSGDWVASGYNRWQLDTIKYNYDCAFLGYGINDSRNDGCPYIGDISQFIIEYSKMIEKLLDNNIALILLDITKMKPNDHPLLLSYSLAIQQLGLKYGIPVFEASELMMNYGAEYYSDITHLNGEGNIITGKKLASAFIGNGVIKKNIVQSHSQLLTRPQIDSCQWGQGVNKISSANYPTCDEIIQSQGFGVLLKAGQSITYSFYCANELLILSPNIMFVQGNSKVKFSLDFGVNQAESSFDYFQLKNTIDFNVEASTLQLDYGSLSFTGVNYSLKQILLNDASYLTIATKGWHTVKIEAIDNDINVFGLSFLNYYDLNKLNYSLNFLGNNGLKFDIGNGSTINQYSSNGKVVFKEKNSPTAILSFNDNEIVLGRMTRFTGLATDPTPIKGGFYFNSSENIFKKCINGTSWIPF